MLFVSLLLGVGVCACSVLGLVWLCFYVACTWLVFLCCYIGVINDNNNNNNNVAFKQHTHVTLQSGRPGLAVLQWNQLLQSALPSTNYTTVQISTSQYISYLWTHISFRECLCRCCFQPFDRFVTSIVQDHQATRKFRRFAVCKNDRANRDARVPQQEEGWYNTWMNEMNEWMLLF